MTQKRFKKLNMHIKFLFVIALCINFHNLFKISFNRCIDYQSIFTENMKRKYQIRMRILKKKLKIK